jgi:hypothetical protein
MNSDEVTSPALSFITHGEGGMNLFCFASKNLENISRGFAARRRAVATVSDSAMRGRITKARKYFMPGALGLLYCKPTHSFTCPFVATSHADPHAVVTDIWPEPWVLPFSIDPFGDPRRQLSAELAVERWAFLARRMGEAGGVTAAINITGATVFVPVEIGDGDWQQILQDLA